MPLYEYACRKCEHTFALTRPMRDRDEPILCPECGSERVVRKLSAFAVPGSTQAQAAPACGNSSFG